jgi:hypothetical protein
VASAGKNVVRIDAAWIGLDPRGVVSQGTTSYRYDALGDFKQVALASGTTIDYGVDGLNCRVGRTVNGVLSKTFVYKDGFKPVAEFDYAGNLVGLFVPNAADAQGRSPVSHRRRSSRSLTRALGFSRAVCGRSALGQWLAVRALFFGTLIGAVRSAVLQR